MCLDRGIASSAMFGSNRRPPTSGAVPAQHPLMMNPGQRDPSRPLRAHQGSLNELYAALELAGGREAIRMLEELLVQAGQGGTESVRINFSEGENGSVHLSIGGRSFMFPSRRNREPATAAQEVKLDYSPQPTAQRWQDELSISPARLKQLTSRLALHIINRLLPEAKRSAEEEAEKRRTAEEGAAAVAARRKEEEAKEKAKNREEELARAAAVTLPESRVPTPLPAAGSSSNQDVDMREYSTTSISSRYVWLTSLSSASGCSIRQYFPDSARRRSGARARTEPCSNSSLCQRSRCRHYGYRYRSGIPASPPRRHASRRHRAAYAGAQQDHSKCQYGHSQRCYDHQFRVPRCSTARDSSRGDDARANGECQTQSASGRATCSSTKRASHRGHVSWILGSLEL